MTEQLLIDTNEPSGWMEQPISVGYVTERGSSADHLHFHVLIGGLRDGDKWPWFFRWDGWAGECWLAYYHRHAGGLRHMLKGARPGSDFEIEIGFPSINTG